MNITMYMIIPAYVHKLNYVNVSNYYLGISEIVLFLKLVLLRYNVHTIHPLSIQFDEF